jgi:hypothetical protein
MALAAVPPSHLPEVAVLALLSLLAARPVPRQRLDKGPARGRVEPDEGGGRQHSRQWRPHAGVEAGQHERVVLGEVGRGRDRARPTAGPRRGQPAGGHHALGLRPASRRPLTRRYAR